jgi:hypothetical protein
MVCDEPSAVQEDPLRLERTGWAENPAVRDKDLEHRTSGRLPASPVTAGIMTNRHDGGGQDHDEAAR